MQIYYGRFRGSGRHLLFGRVGTRGLNSQNMVGIELFGIYFTLGVSIISAWIGYNSYQGQARMAVREAIEQIEPLRLGQYEKIRPTLSRFNYSLRGSQSSTRVTIQHYDSSAKASVSSLAKDFGRFDDEEKAELKQFVCGLSNVSDAYFSMRILKPNSESEIQ